MLMCLAVSLVISVGVNEIDFLLKMDSKIRLTKILKILTDYLRQLELRYTTGAIRRLAISKIARMMMIVSSRE